MLITVNWHDPTDRDEAPTAVRSKIVEVRERPSKDDYFLGGILNQAMRQAGYSEEEIHAQNYVGPVEFIFEKKKPIIAQTLAVPATLAECRPDQVENWWAAYVSARGG